jgi:hypothetical protein
LSSFAPRKNVLSRSERRQWGNCSFTASEQLIGRFRAENGPSHHANAAMLFSSHWREGKGFA